jgi:hypothetical protein
MSLAKMEHPGRSNDSLVAAVPLLVMEVCSSSVFFNSLSNQKRAFSNNYLLLSPKLFYLLDA